jgi:hypothetical protein
MEQEAPQVLFPFMVATALFVCSLLSYGTAMHLIVRLMVTLTRSGYSDLGFWESTAALAIVMLITAGAHLTQIALWAVALFLCGQISTAETAFYFSAQTYTALGYGDIQLSERWRLLGPLEAMNGLLFLGLSTAVLFAIMSQLIANRLHTETGYQGGAAGNREPRSASGDGSSK